ncbi:MAG: hydroxymethylglutaryl-CoA reductase, degradative [Myxococcota bacterium]
MSQDSRIPRFHARPLSERQAILGERETSEETKRFLGQGQTGLEVLDVMSENVVGRTELPLSVALNFRVNGRDVLVPMSVEEPSVVAAASHAAKLVRAGGGFVGEADRGIMTAQVQLDGVPEPKIARGRVHENRAQLLAAANEAIPNMVARGGGCIDADARVLDEREGVFVVHLYVDVGDAMGANLVDTVAEAVAPLIQTWVGGDIGLRILSNLPLRRMIRVGCRIPSDALGITPSAVARASRFAELDPFRAVTHNKGIMNAIDAVAVAMGQDWRSIEAGAHAFAAMSGSYRPLATWKVVDDGLEGRLEMPLAVATVGGSTRALPGIRAAFDLMRPGSAGELGLIMGAAGMACNLAALRALAGEGIQKGHMRLHRRKTEGTHS